MSEAHKMFLDMVSRAVEGGDPAAVMDALSLWAGSLLHCFPEGKHDDEFIHFGKRMKDAYDFKPACEGCGPIKATHVNYEVH